MTDFPPRQPPKMTKAVGWVLAAALYVWCAWTLYTAVTIGMAFGGGRTGPKGWYDYADHPMRYVLIVGFSALVVTGPALAWGGLRLFEALARGKPSPSVPPVEEPSHIRNADER